MSGYLYEKDLVSQKYRILVSVRHDKLVREIASELGIPLQELRRYLIEHLDMILLENLPARAEAARTELFNSDEVATALGKEKYTIYIPILPVAAMDSIFRDVNERVRTGTPVAEAVACGRAQIREALRR
jgi:energy-converting hydrogenase A subunit M